MTIRSAGTPLLDAILDIHRDAFGPGQGQEIASLVEGLLGDDTATPLLSLVAEDHGTLTGHILFTNATVLSHDRTIQASMLAPLAVPKHAQGTGAGSALVREGLKRLAASGVELVFVLGHPGYYPRFGFQPAGVLGLDAPYPIPAKNADAWMVQAYHDSLLGRVSGTVECAKTLMQPEHWLE